MKVKIKILVYLIVAFACVDEVMAYSFKSDGIYYNITSKSAGTVSVTFESTSFESYSGEISIPSAVVSNGVTYKVTSIGTRTFYNCPNLESVSLPNTITALEDEAFSFCSSLRSVAMNEGLSVIGANAFYMCVSLTDAKVPGSVKSIGDYAFRYCSSLTSINIPKSVLKIGHFAFSDCTGVTSIVVEDGNPNYDSREGCNALIETVKNRLFLACCNSTIPQGVVTVGGTAFYNMKTLQSIDIPSSVTTIESLAFSGCKNLTSINIPNSVAYIGSDAFEHCANLSSISLPNSLTEISDELFWDCPSLESIIIPKSVTKIGQGAFYGCKRLQSVTIPSSVKVISNYAFGMCTSLSDFILDTEGQPISLTWNTFMGVSLSSASLHVKRKYATLYEDAYIWNSFGSIVPSTMVLGDADGNEIVDNDDVRLLSDYLLNRDVDYIDTDAIDLDNSGSIDLADLTSMMCKLNAVQPDVSSQMPIACDLYPLGGYMNVEPGGKLNINVITRSTSRKYSSFLFDLKLPEGVNFVDGNNGIVQKGKSMSIDAHIQYEILPDGAVRVLGYNPSLEANDIYYADLLRFTISADTNLQEGELPISISNISFSYRGNVQHSNEHTSILTVANPLPDAIVPISSSSMSNTIITLDGISRPAHVKGVNIIRDSNGTVRKIKSN